MKFDTKKQAALFAKLETTRVGKKHIPFLTSYYNNEAAKTLPVWTVILAKNEKLLAIICGI